MPSSTGGSTLIARDFEVKKIGAYINLSSSIDTIFSPAFGINQSQVRAQHVLARDDVLLAEHLAMPHQLGALRHDRVHHHRRHSNDLVALGVVRGEAWFLGVRFALDDYVVVTARRGGCVAAVASGNGVSLIARIERR